MAFHAGVAAARDSRRVRGTGTAQVDFIDPRNISIDVDANGFPVGTSNPAPAAGITSSDQCLEIYNAVMSAAPPAGVTPFIASPPDFWALEVAGTCYYHYKYDGAFDLDGQYVGFAYTAVGEFWWGGVPGLLIYWSAPEGALFHNL